MNLLRKNRAQKGSSTIEFTVVVATGLSVLIVFLQPGGLFQNAFSRVLDSTSSGMEEMGGRIGAPGETTEDPLMVAVGFPDATPIGGPIPVP